jgi:hypothetical protein
MERRTFIATSVSAGITALAGCGGSTEAPPRKSNVINEITLENNATILSVQPEPKGDRWLMTRRDIDNVGQTAQPAMALPTLSDLSPVGVASAKGRGATGRGGRGGGSGFRSAPKTTNGRARLYGGPYVGTYYDDHDEDIERYPTTIERLGIAYLGTNEKFKETAPGPGPVPWDEEYESDISGELAIQSEDVHNNLEDDTGKLKDGWFRVGTNVGVPLEDGGVRMLGWESVDVRVESEDGTKQITERWKVSPRI